MANATATDFTTSLGVRLPGVISTYVTDTSTVDDLTTSSTIPHDDVTTSSVATTATTILRTLVNDVISSIVTNDDVTTTTLLSSSSITTTATTTTSLPVTTQVGRHGNSGDDDNKIHDTSLTSWLPNPHDLARLHASYNLYVLYATFGLMVLGFLILVCWIQCRRRWILFRYQRLPSAEEQTKDGYSYKPSHGGLLDEEYENTFVGVSIPILQDVTKL